MFATHALAVCGGMILMVIFAFIANKVVKSEEETLMESILANNQRLIDLVDLVQAEADDLRERVIALELEVEERREEQADLETELTETKKMLFLSEQENEALHDADVSTEIVPVPTQVNLVAQPVNTLS